MSYSQSTERPKSNIILLAICLLIYVVLFIIDFSYCKEVASYIDAATEILYIISQGTFRFFAGRWGLFSTQLIPLIGVKSGFGFETIIILYAMSTLMVSFFMFMYVWRFLSPYAAAAICLSNILGISDSYFARQWSVLLGIQYFILFVAWLKYHERLRLPKMIDYAIPCWLVTLLFSTHTMFFPAVFTALILEYMEVSNRRYILFLSFLSTGFLLFKVLIEQGSEYEKYRYISTIVGLMSLSQYTFLLKNLLGGFYILPLLLFIFIGFKKIKTSAYKGVIFLVLVLMNIAMALASVRNVPLEKPYFFYYEGALLPAISIISIYTLIELFSGAHTSKWGLGIYILCAVYYSSYLLLCAIPERKRNADFMTQFTKEVSDRCDSASFIILDVKKFPLAYNPIYWECSNNTLILTQLKSGHAILLFLTNDTKNYGTETAPFFVVRDDFTNIPFSIDNPLTYMSPFRPYDIYKGLNGKSGIHIRNQKVRVLK